MTDIKINTVELGRIYEQQGYFKKAADHFSGAFKADPENPVLIEALDRINAKKNDTDDHNESNDSSDPNNTNDIIDLINPIDPIDSIDQINPIDKASLAGMVEQWAHLVILSQRAERLARKLER